MAKDKESSFMQEKIYNENNIDINDIDEVETRTKAIMVNYENKVLMGYYKKVYQFIGGHLKINETKEQCLHREILEETGIDIDTSLLRPFYVIKYYGKSKDNKNVLSEIYYYDIPNDEIYHLSNTNYDKEEVDGNYELRYVDLDNFDEIMINSIANEDELNEIIIRDNIEVMHYYKDNYLYKNIN